MAHITGAPRMQGFGHASIFEGFNKKGVVCGSYMRTSSYAPGLDSLSGNPKT